MGGLSGHNLLSMKLFAEAFPDGPISEIDLASPKLGRTYADRNAKLCTIIRKIAEGLNEFSTNTDALGDAYEYLIGQFAAGSGKKAGEFYTPQQISDILSAIVTLDSQEPRTGKKDRLAGVLDFACGSGSFLLNVRKRMGRTASASVSFSVGRELLEGRMIKFRKLDPVKIFLQVNHSNPQPYPEEVPGAGSPERSCPDPAGFPP
jgi:type I restriction enzyme M protein